MYSATCIAVQGDKWYTRLYYKDHNCGTHLVGECVYSLRLSCNRVRGRNNETFFLFWIILLWHRLEFVDETEKVVLLHLGVLLGPLAQVTGVLSDQTKKETFSRGRGSGESWPAGSGFVFFNYPYCIFKSRIRISCWIEFKCSVL